jgi:hypothetical protein
MMRGDMKRFGVVVRHRKLGGCTRYRNRPLHRAIFFRYAVLSTTQAAARMALQSVQHDPRARPGRCHRAG